MPAKKGNQHNRTGKLKACAAKSKSEVLPPVLHEANLPAPRSLETVKEIREEMARIYKLVFEGKIMIEQATKLAYYLDKMIQAIKTEVELDTIKAAYAQAWGGVNIITNEEDFIDEKSDQ